MKIIRPKPVTLISSTVVDVAPALYAAGTTYAEGATASTAGTLGVLRVWRSLSAGNVGHAPATSPTFWAWVCDTYQAYNPATTYAAQERAQDNAAKMIYESVAAGNVGQTLTDVSKWLPVGTTNKWAAYDDTIGTVTSGAGPLTQVIKAGSLSGIGFIELSGRDLIVTGRDGSGGPVVYGPRTVVLDGSIIESFFDWFFADYEQLGDVALTDLPEQFENLELTITITSTAQAAGVGVIKPGKVFEIGETQMGATIDNLSFTRKVRDENFGTVSIIRRGNAKLANFEVLTPASSLNKIYRLLASIDGELCFYIGTDEPGFEPLLIYGFYRDHSIAIEYDLFHLLNIQIEGVV